MTIDKKDQNLPTKIFYRKVTVRWKEGHIRDSIKSSTHQEDDSQRGKIIISHKFSRRGESSEPHVRLPSLGVCHQEEESSEHSACKARGLDCELSGTGETETPLLEGAHKGSCTARPGNCGGFRGGWDKATCWSWSVSWAGGGWLWLRVGTRTLVTEIPRNTH